MLQLHMTVAIGRLGALGLVLLWAFSATACDGWRADAEPSQTEDRGPEGVSDEPSYVSRPLEERVDAAESRLRERGFSSVGDPIRAFLVERSTTTQEISLDDRRCHVVIAVGSSGLTEIDIDLYDSAGTRAASGTAGSGGAVLHHCPDHPGTYFVAIRSAAGNGLVSARRMRGPRGIEVAVDEALGPVGEEETPPRAP